MEKTYEWPDYDVRVTYDKQKQPQSLVITSKDGSRIDDETAKAGTKGVATSMKAHNGNVTVFADQGNGKFDQYKMEIHKPHRTIEVSQRGEPERNISSQETEKRVSQIKERVGELSASSESAREARKEYLNEQRNKPTQ